MDKKRIDPVLVAEVAAALPLSKRAKLLESIRVLNASIAAGGWLPRGKAATLKGFGGGLAKGSLDHKDYSDPKHELFFALYMAFGCGHTGYGELLATATPEDIARSVANARIGRAPVSLELATAYIRLLLVTGATIKDLDDSRPPPRVTAIGLSPKVTATLTGCGLDLDLASIEPAKIDYVMVPRIDPKTGKPMLDRLGAVVMTRHYYVAWTEGCKFGCSRFVIDGSHCEACGKYIPSHRFVAVEANDRKLGRIGLWLGCDCAKNIFGIVDVGIDPKAKPPSHEAETP